MIANCLRTYGVFPLDTRDSLYRPKVYIYAHMCS